MSSILSVENSPLVSMPVIERDYTSGEIGGGSPSNQMSSAPVEPTPAPSPEPTNAQMAQVVAPAQSAPSGPPPPPPQSAPSGPPPPPVDDGMGSGDIYDGLDEVPEMQYSDDLGSMDLGGSVGSEETEVQIPRSTAKAAAKQIVDLLSYGTNMLIDNSVKIDINSIEMAITKGEIRPEVLDAVKKINSNTTEALYLQEDEKQMLINGLVEVIIEKNITAASPTNALIMTAVTIAVTKFIAIKQAIAANKKLVTDLLIESARMNPVVAQQPVSQSPDPHPGGQKSEVKSNGKKVREWS